jgi:hypothetical protein
MEKPHDLLKTMHSLDKLEMLDLLLKWFQNEHDLTPRDNRCTEEVLTAVALQTYSELDRSECLGA